MYGPDINHLGDTERIWILDLRPITYFRLPMKSLPCHFRCLAYMRPEHEEVHQYSIKSTEGAYETKTTAQEILSGKGCFVGVYHFLYF